MADYPEAKINNERKAKEKARVNGFYDYLERNLDNLKLKLGKLNNVYKRRLKKQYITQSEYDQKLQSGVTRILEIKENNSDILEFIEETEDSYIFKLTDLYKDILKRIIRDSSNFRCINPQFQQYSLNPDQLEKVKRIFGKTLINGMYDKKGKDGIYCITDKNENFKEGHIDEYYDILGESDNHIWGLTVIHDENGNPINEYNGGTELIKVPILRHKALQKINQLTKSISFNIFRPFSCMIGERTGEYTAKTLHSAIFCSLTSLYVDENTTDWDECPLNTVHNVASCYYHRSCQSIKPRRPIERIHWANHENPEIKEVIDTLK